MKSLFIINPNSGKKRYKYTAAKIQEYCTENKEKASLVIWEYKDQLSELVENAKKDNVDIIFAVGGDGTIHEIGKLLIGTDIALGIIPAGSGNGISRHLGIPQKVGSALKLLHSGKIERIDTGIANGQVFIGFMGFGVDAIVAHQFQNIKTRGFRKYFELAMKEYFAKSTEKFTIIIDGKEHKINPQIMAVSNVSQFGNGCVIAPGASCKDGKMEVCSMDPFPHFWLPVVIYRIFTAKITGSKYYKRFSFTKCTIVRGNTHRLAQVDGEPISTEKEVHVEVVPKSLNILIPGRIRKV